MNGATVSVSRFRCGFLFGSHRGNVSSPRPKASVTGDYRRRRTANRQPTHCANLAGQYLPQTWGLTRIRWNHWGRNCIVITSFLTDTFPACCRKPAATRRECVGVSKEFLLHFSHSNYINSVSVFDAVRHWICVFFLAAHGRVQHDDRHIQSVLYVAISSTASVVLIGECHPWGLQECGKQDFSSCSFPELQTRILDEKGSRHIQWP